jgi:hypothetical protein
MKKFWLLSAGLVVLSGSMFADTIGAGTGSLVAVPTTASFLGSQVAYTGSPVNATNSQVPFWNNPSEDTINSHVANVGDVLGGVVVGNVIGSNLVSGNINGSYYASGTGNGDPVTSTANTFTTGLTVNGTASATYSSEVPALEFSFQSAATAYNIALLFADSAQNTGCAVGANCPIPTGTSNGIGTVFGTYTETNSNTGNFTLTPLTDPVNNMTGTPTTIATGQTLAPNTSFYGFYATVCYMSTNVGGVSTCTYSVTYTSGAGNFSTQSTNTTYLGGEGWNHFALFELANGEEVVGFKDYPWGPGNSNSLESIGDFNDIIIGLTPQGTSSAPEPATIAFMGLGLAGLGLLGRRRFTKK